MNPAYFKGCGWGVLRTKPSAVYEECRRMKKSYVIVRDYVPFVSRARDILSKCFENIKMMRSGHKMLSELVIDSQSVYKYFLSVHKYNANPENQLGRDFRFTEVIFIELTTHVSHEVEYLLLLFKYLLYQHNIMPQLFVVYDYPTDVFDFIDINIMGKSISKWDGSDEDVKNILLVQPGSYKNTQYLLPHFESLDPQSLVVIVSSNNVYEKELAKGLEKYNLAVFGDIDSYTKATSRGSIPVLLLRSAEDMFDLIDRELIKPTSVIFDPRFKTGVNMYYSGNIPMPMTPNQNYIKSVLFKLENIPYLQKVNTFIYTSTCQELTRSIFVRSPIIDYMQMNLHKLDMLLLYTHYYNGSSMKNFLQMIRASADMLRTLRFEEGAFTSGPNSAYSKCVHLNIHPLVISLIENWFERRALPVSTKSKEPIKMPRLPILVFVAVMLTANTKDIVEIKEHGTREHESDVSRTSLCGQLLFRYMKLMQQHRSVIIDDGNETSKMLKRLIEAYKIEEDEMVLFDHNSFMIHLVDMIYEHYRPYILKQYNQLNYHGEYNVMMNWRIKQTTNIPPEILPFTVSMGATSKSISLFIPLGRM
jgi:hypothetical protein